MSVYRDVSKDGTGTPPPRVLVYEPIDRAATSSSAAALFKLVTFPAVVGAVLGATVNGVAGAVGIVAAVGVGIALRRRGREQATLTLEGGRLAVVHGKHRLEALALDEVRNVELEIKKIQRVQEGSSAVPAVRFINSTVGPEIDTARIVIVTRTSRMVLSDNYVAHIDALEWLGKIRLFLRDSGWRPVDERASADEEEDDDESVMA